MRASDLRQSLDNLASHRHASTRSGTGRLGNLLRGDHVAEHELAIPIEASEWFTPLSIFRALGLVFDLDPCNPAWSPGDPIVIDKFEPSHDDGSAILYPNGRVVELGGDAWPNINAWARYVCKCWTEWHERKKSAA